MIFYLRDKDNDKDIAEIEYYETLDYLEIYTKLYIRNYSSKLCNLEGRDKFDFVNNMEFISDLRDWLHKDHFKGRKNTSSEYEEVLEALRKILKNVAKRTDTYVVED
jgi:hypothetical protein